MSSKLLFFLSFYFFLDAVRGDCSWTDAEKKESCCELPNVRSEFAKKCAEELDYVYPPVQTTAYDKCGEECIFKKIGFLTEDQKIDGDKVMELGMKKNKPEWVDTVHHGIEHCNSKTFENGNEKCSAAPALYTHCLVHYMYSHCPDQFWTNNDNCNSIKEKLKKCPDLIPPPHPFSIIPK